MRLSDPPDRERTDLRNPLVVAVNVNYTQAMVKGSLGDQQVGYRRAMPHPMVMGKIPLQSQCPVEDVDWRSDDIEALVDCDLEFVVVPCRPAGVELLELADRAEVEESRQLFQVPAGGGFIGPSRRALVEEPTI